MKKKLNIKLSCSFKGRWVPLFFLPHICLLLHSCITFILCTRRAKRNYFWCGPCICCVLGNCHYTIASLTDIIQMANVLKQLINYHCLEFDSSLNCLNLLLYFKEETLNIPNKVMDGVLHLLNLILN